MPEAKFVIAHGQMAATELEDKIGAFYDGKYDILLSTAIVESGLDIPTANTMIVHRADMFGLAQLYQLRGRVGRSKTRAYALFTVPANKPITPQAEKRLKVLQSLDTLGAGFQLASHDLDIRGAGNLLGDEQSGHIKEVGYELYQQMVQEAVERAEGGRRRAGARSCGRRRITLGAPVTIPEDYIPDLPTAAAASTAACRRSRTDEEIEAMGAEIDRPLRAAAAGGRPADEARGDQGAVPARQCREGRRRPEGRHARLPRQFLRQSRRRWCNGWRARARSPRCAPTCASSSSAISTRSPTGSKERSKIMREIAKIAARKG